MNNKGQLGVKGFALVTVFFIFILALNGLIPIFKETLDDNRENSSLNCPGTPEFNQTAYNNQSTDERLQKRPVCFVTGISMVWFYLAFLSAAVVWVYVNWSK